MTHSRVLKCNITDKYICFHSGPFSNWYMCNIIYDGKEFTSSEQLFMYLKAIYFQDECSAEEILKVYTPREAKNLGRKVKGFNQDRWDKVKYDLMFESVYAKFDQNKELQTILLNPEYDNKCFVEGSPTDRIWGVGLDWQDPLIDDKENWKGLNLLGKVLNEVRDDLKTGFLFEC